jgi:hypothetical protein
MERYRDFRAVLKELIDKRIRLSFFLDTADVTGKYEAFGKIRRLNDHSLTIECDPEPGNVPSTKTHLNLAAIVIYAIDEIPEDFDLTEKPEPKIPRGTLIKSIPINEANQFIEKGWMIHETYEETVTLLKYLEEK